ncbi:hypothetical protein F5050DRAFT_494092 [Lentinula boryana]|uniref:Uncharacterized protein n=1 Tax=Lentinula boryana TaxID=40481 RepID=A0ABQ8QV82_9AGAR|nr:hypothetical protein F5050DRAFT_494092 [Lentinula boryana]
MHLYHRTSFGIYFVLFLVFVCTAMPFSAYSLPQDAPASVHLIGEKRTKTSGQSKSVKVEFICQGGQEIKGSEAFAKLVRYLDVVAEPLGFSSSIKHAKYSPPWRNSEGTVQFSLTTKEKAVYIGFMAVGNKSNVGRDLTDVEQYAISEEPLTDFTLYFVGKHKAWEIVVKMKGGIIQPQETKKD